MKVKICGLSNAKEVITCIKYGADFCGFILNYPKSHRYINFEKTKELLSIKKNKTKSYENRSTTDLQTQNHIKYNRRRGNSRDQRPTDLTEL